MTKKLNKDWCYFVCVALNNLTGLFIHCEKTAPCGRYKKLQEFVDEAIKADRERV